MWLETFAPDIQYGARSLLKSPGFSLLAILSLATGIMATTAMYSVLHAVVLDPFTYKDVDRLMRVRVYKAGNDDAIPEVEFAHRAIAQRTFDLRSFSDRSDAVALHEHGAIVDLQIFIDCNVPADD